MPTLSVPPDLEMFYRIDDFTDPWSRAGTVVFLHGNAESGEAWRAWVPYFARRYRVTRPDQRGFGQSTPMPRHFLWTLDVLVEDLARFVKGIGVDRLHLVAAKFGGAVAISFAARHPQWLQSLTLLGTPPAPKRSLAATIPAWVAHMERHGVKSWARWTMRGRLGSAVPEEAIEWWVELMGATALSTQLGFMRMVPQVDVTGDLERIGCPTLVITTTGSGLGSVAEVERWQQRIPRSELLVLPGDSYHVAGSDPDTCARATLAFVDRHGGSSCHDRPATT